jgi:hypothetical protein
MNLLTISLLSILFFLWINLALQFFIVHKWLVLLAMIFSLLMAFWLFRNEREPIKFKKKYLLAIPLLIPVLWQAFRVLYIEDRKLWVHNVNNLGDLPYHLGLANYLQHSNFWPKNYIFANESLKYPFAVDYLHALLQNFLSYEYLYPLLTALGLVFISCISIRLVGVGFLYVLFCNGSFWLLPQEQVSWKNFLLAIYIPQRGYLLALPIGLFLLSRLWQNISDKKIFTLKDAVIYGIMLGSLAWVHLHTYVFFAVFTTYLFLRWRSKNLFLLLAIGAIIGFPFVATSTDLFTKASSIRWQWVWDKPEGEATLTFLFKNLGFLLLLPLSLPFFKRPEVRYWLVGTSSLFALFLVCILSMWPWDNIKILLWAYLAFMFVFLQEIPYKKLKVFIVVLLSAPGFYTIFHSTFIKPNPQVIFYLDEVDAYKNWFQGENTEAVYIATPTYNHPVFMYGAKVLMGYEGHLWSHGVNYVSVLKKYEEMQHFTTIDEWRKFAQQTGAQYLVYSPREEQAFGRFLSVEYLQKVYSYQDLVIYKID